jgi:hypothetical protein
MRLINQDPTRTKSFEIYEAVRRGSHWFATTQGLNTTINRTRLLLSSRIETETFSLVKNLDPHGLR